MPVSMNHLRLCYLLSLCAACTISVPAQATAACDITNYEIISHDHGGTYVGGVIDGQYRSFLILCGVVGGTSDCSAPATDRNLAVALTARALGRPLRLFFDSVSACANVTNYSQVTNVTLTP